MVTECKIYTLPGGVDGPIYAYNAMNDLMQRAEIVYSPWPQGFWDLTHDENIHPSWGHSENNPCHWIAIENGNGLTTVIYEKKDGEVVAKTCFDSPFVTGISSTPVIEPTNCHWYGDIYGLWGREENYPHALGFSKTGHVQAIMKWNYFLDGSYTCLPDDSIRIDLGTIIYIAYPSIKGDILTLYVPAQNETWVLGLSER